MDGGDGGTRTHFRSFAGCCLVHFGIATKLFCAKPAFLPESVAKLLPATPTYPDQVSVDSNKETVTVSCGHKEKTHRPATLAVGRNPVKLNGKLVGQPPAPDKALAQNGQPQHIAFIWK